jgi:uncharacterized protein HemX
MTGTRRKITSVLLVAGIAVGVAACGQSSQAATCDRVDSVRASVEDLRNVNLSENGMAALDSALAQVKTELELLRSDVKADLQPQVDAVRSSVTQLRSSVRGALTYPTSGSLAAVGTSVDQLRATVANLSTAVSAGC